MARTAPEGPSRGIPASGSNRRHAKGSRWEAFARGVIQHYGGLCHLCGHGGARSVDHLVVVAERPELEWELSNCRPAHNAPYNKCVVCSAAAGKPIYCNQIRGALSVERAQRLIAERTANGAPANKTYPGAGREW